MNRINTIEQPLALTQRAPQPEASAPAVPDWLRAATLTLRTKFATPKDGRGEWSPDDTAAYGRVLAKLGPERCAAVIQQCRERHVWRPTVAEVVNIIDELAGRTTEAISGADAAARKVVRRPLALPPHPDNPARMALRAKLGRLKADLAANGDWPELRVVQGGESEAA